MTIDTLQHTTRESSQESEDDPSSLADKLASFGEDALEKLERAERALRISATLSHHAIHATQYANELTQVRTSLGELLAVVETTKETTK